MMGILYQAIKFKDKIGRINMDRGFYIEWLYLTGDYSKEFYEKMCDQELERAYLDMIEERSC